MHSTKFTEVGLHGDVVVFTRTLLPYTHAEAFETEVAHWRLHFPASMRARRVLVWDLRKSQFGREPAFDPEQVEQHRELLLHWNTTFVVVRDLGCHLKVEPVLAQLGLPGSLIHRDLPKLRTILEKTVRDRGLTYSSPIPSL